MEPTAVGLAVSSFGSFVESFDTPTTTVVPVDTVMAILHDSSVTFPSSPVLVSSVVSV